MRRQSLQKHCKCGWPPCPREQDDGWSGLFRIPRFLLRWRVKSSTCDTQRLVVLGSRTCPPPSQPPSYRHRPTTQHCRDRLAALTTMRARLSSRLPELGTVKVSGPGGIQASEGLELVNCHARRGTLAGSAMAAQHPHTWTLLDYGKLAALRCTDDGLRYVNLRDSAYAGNVVACEFGRPSFEDR